mgnify:CR=1 FL=1
MAFAKTAAIGAVLGLFLAVATGPNDQQREVETTAQH